MSGHREAPALTWYRRLLMLCPEPFRRQYGAAMEQAFADLAREPRHQSTIGRVRLWMLSVHDVAVTAIAERTSAMGDTLRPARTLRVLMIANATLFIAVGAGIIGVFGPAALLRAYGMPLIPPDPSTPLGLVRMFAVVLIGFGVLLLTVTHVADEPAGTRVSGGLAVAYTFGAPMLLAQQVAIWTTTTGAVTVAVTALLAVAYGAVYVVRRRAALDVRTTSSGS